jgi:hypothetical protein
MGAQTPTPTTWLNIAAIARTISGSMQGRREQRCADINAILKERVNL